MDSTRYRPALQEPGRFWHITDLHLDATYHLTDDPTKVCFSSKGAPTMNAGIYGDFLCDSPYRLIQSAFTQMSQVVPQADFIIWTGDSPPHVPAGELSTDTVIQLMSNMSETIRDHFPRLPVYPALGGFYSQLARPGLRVLSLNTILYYGPDKATVNASDPAGQYQWATGHSGESCTEPGDVGYLPFARDVTAIRRQHNERLVAIFRKYSHVIAGHFYGHTHRDSLMVLLGPDGKPLNSMFVSPAVTPIKRVSEPYSNNPAFRMCFYDSSDFTLLDIWQYYLNLTEANERQRAEWRREYVMTEAFGLKDLRPQSLLQLALGFRLPQAKSFDKYFSHFMVSYNESLRCENDCKLSQVCAVLYLDHQGYSDCVGGRSVKNPFTLL
ncbi:hypothetical protein CRUP_032285 [Coryphaenoides rupestris]|nr:hypothetical protein CRUP_032285 [Coryphaenoides rupestris]